LQKCDFWPFLALFDYPPPVRNNGGINFFVPSEAVFAHRDFTIAEIFRICLRKDLKFV